MKIGIDISQLAYPNTGVANYLKSLVENMVNADSDNEYVLFFSSLRRNFQFSIFNFQSNNNITIKQFKFPSKLLDLVWNRLHIAPIEWFIGDVDVFITSDWTEPPVKRTKKATIIYDMVVYKYPEETAQIIKNVQKRKNEWVRKESNIVFAISESAKNDIIEILGISEGKIQVIYPGITL